MTDRLRTPWYKGARDLAISPIRLLQRSSVRFVVVGGISLVVDTGMLFLLHGVVGVVLPVATAVAFCIALLLNFALNHLWAFESSMGFISQRMARYLSLAAANLVVTVLMVNALTAMALPYLWAKVLCMGSLFVANYFISSKWIYGRLRHE